MKRLSKDTVITHTTQPPGDWVQRFMLSKISGEIYVSLGRKKRDGACYVLTGGIEHTVTQSTDTITNFNLSNLSCLKH